MIQVPWATPMPLGDPQPSLVAPAAARSEGHLPDGLKNKVRIRSYRLASDGVSAAKEEKEKTKEERTNTDEGTRNTDKEKTEKEKSKEKAKEKKEQKKILKEMPKKRKQKSEFKLIKF